MRASVFPGRHGGCAEHDLEDFTQAKTVIASIIDHYNHAGLHSALNFLRPVDSRSRIGRVHWSSAVGEGSNDVCAASDGGIRGPTVSLNR